jgi:putative copper export protein
MMYFLSILVHTFLASSWLGLNLSIIFIVRFVLSDSNIKNSRHVLIENIALKFRRFSYLILFFILISGITNLIAAGVPISELKYYFFHGNHGKILSLKFFIFIFLIIMSLFHDFYLGPKYTYLISKEEDDAEIGHLRTTVRSVGILNFLLTCLLFGLGVFLSRLGKI